MARYHRTDPPLPPAARAYLAAFDQLLAASKSTATPADREHADIACGHALEPLLANVTRSARGPRHAAYDQAA